MRDPFSNRSVERGLVLGKGWFQIDVILTKCDRVLGQQRGSARF